MNTSSIANIVGYKYTYREVPDDPELNRIWRETTLDYCSRNHPDAAKLREIIMEKCRKDFWYFVKGFCYVHETRILDDDAEFGEMDTKIPFLPWPHQVPVIDHILSRLGKKDIRILKSRAQGASWIMILIAAWVWLFHKGVGNFMSKDEDSVDTKGDMNSLFAKLDWLLGVLPEWMVGKKKVDWNRNTNDHTFTRSDGETAINGFACTPNVATGGRSLYTVMDEHGKHPRPNDKHAMASLQPTTRCRISLSTPWGMDGEFAKLIHDETIDEPVLILAWWDNPSQNRGLYRIVKGQPVAVDEAKYGPLTDTYRDHEKWKLLKTRLMERGYDLTSDQQRSEWYDTECLRQGANPVLIAQEYDMKFGAEGAQYFADALINRLKNNTRRPLRGDFYVDQESLTCKWSENPDGLFRLWCELDAWGKPPMGEYVVGVDVSAGLGGEGGSNSCITVFNRRTGQKVLAFASPLVKPYILAEIAVALCRLFCNYRGDPAFLIWENQGPGKEFCQRVERSGFQHYYRRKSSDDAPLHSRHTDKPGYWMRKRSAILGPYREALLEGDFDNPDMEAVSELPEYQMGQDGEPYHVASKDKSDPAGAGFSHGDRVMADALAWHAVLFFGDQHKGHVSRNKPNVMNARDDNVPRSSFAWRRAEYLKMVSKKKQESNW